MLTLLLLSALLGPPKPMTVEAECGWAPATPIQDSVTKLAAEFPNCAPAATDSERIRCLEAGLVEVKRVADDTASCIQASFVGAGADLLAVLLGAAVDWLTQPPQETR